MEDRLRVLFLCTGNSARSQMAEALLRHLSRGRIEALSAGSEPELQIHPLAKATLESKFGIDCRDLRPKSMNRFSRQHFDFVITVCERTIESCPVFPGDPERIHWGFEDPTSIADADAQRRAFESVASGLAARLRIWMALPQIRNRMDVHV